MSGQWATDPWARYPYRWHDGGVWTEHVSDGPSQYRDAPGDRQAPGFTPAYAAPSVPHRAATAEANALITVQTHTYDHAGARADAKAAKARAKALRPFYLKKRYWALTIVALVVIVNAAGGGSNGTTTDASSFDPDTGAALTSAPPADPPPVAVAAAPQGSVAAPLAEAPAPTVAPAPQGSTSDFDVRIDGATFGSDFEGKGVIVVTFAFTNNSDGPASFMFSLNAQAFQGGIELDGFAIGVDGIDTSLEMADIQPGVTLSVPVAFLLRDGSNVTVEVREQFSFSDDVLVSQQFSITP